MRPFVLILVLAATSVAHADLPDSVGSATFRGENAALTLGFGAQIRTTSVEGDSALTLHRARPAFLARFLDDRLRFRIHLDVAPRAFELLDLFVEGEPSSSLRVRFGIAKIPFTLHWDQGYLAIPFVDWAPTTRWITGRQLGLTVFGDTGHWRWAAGLHHGATLRPANGQRLPRVYGEAPLHRLDLRDPAPLGRLRPEVVARVSHHAGPAAVALSGALDLAPHRIRDERLRVALDGHLHWPALDVWAVGALALTENGDGDAILGYGTALLEAELRPHPRFGVALRHSVVVRSNALRRDARRWAMEQIATTDRSREDYASVGHTRAEHEATVAVNAYVIGSDLKLQADASWLRTRGDAPTDGWRVRVQANLGF